MDWCGTFAYVLLWLVLAIFNADPFNFNLPGATNLYSSDMIKHQIESNIIWIEIDIE